VIVRIAKQAAYCPNYTIHGVVLLYQTTVSLPDYFLKAMQCKMLVTLGSHARESAAWEPPLLQFSVY